MPRPRVVLRYDRRCRDFAVELLGRYQGNRHVLRMPTLVEGRAWAVAAAIQLEIPFVDLTDCQPFPSDLREIPA